MFQPSAASSGPPSGSVPVPQGPRVWRIQGWDSKNNGQRVAVLSGIARDAAADPRLRRLAVQVFKSAGVEPRNYRGQAAALLRFLQDRVYFVNEQDEVLQDPCYTLSLGPDGSVGSDAHGDCDDQAVALAALARSVHLPVRFVTSGRDRNGRSVRWVEGKGASPPGVGWSHVYVAIGDHPFRPSTFLYADPTVKGAALGWDVVSRGDSDPQRGSYGGDDGAERISGMNLRTAATLVAVSVISNLVVKKFEQAGWI